MNVFLSKECEHAGQAPFFAAYVYPGWHSDSYRPGVNEWDLLRQFRPYFPGHERPPQPLAGYYDDSDPATAAAQIALAQATGIGAFLYFLYYGADGFVMSQPVSAALEAAVAAQPFAVAGSWCIRLPHPDFPVAPEHQQDGVTMPCGDAKAQRALEGQVLLERLSLSELATFSERIGLPWKDVPMFIKSPLGQIASEARGATEDPPPLTLGRLRDLLEAMADAADETGRPPSGMTMLRLLERAGLHKISVNGIALLAEAASSGLTDLTIKQLETLLTKIAAAR